MSHLVGYVHCSYADLVATFGPSHCWSNDKSDAEWKVDVPGVGTAYVYNYADGRNYLGAAGAPVEGITEWHVGGESAAVVDPIHQMICRATTGPGATP